MAPKQQSTTMTKPSDIPQEVPMFLRKTYHMIDSCDPAVACWSEDGETFVVKDPTKFESEIIPQFFKHSKFTSFVRQLNFYSFRKIKYVDTIRLDPKLEAETANFWRFRHEKFQRGKPHLLTEIKRMTASQSRAAAEKAAKAAAQADGVPSSSVATDNSAMKEEIDTLKKRLEEMNKNMNELTSMVQKVSLQDSAAEEPASAGNKRKKVDFMPTPEPVISDGQSPLPEATLDLLLGDQQKGALFAGMDMDMDMDVGLDTPGLGKMQEALPSPEANLRASSTTSNMTDADFVDQLFDAFGESEEEQDGLLPEPEAVMSHPGQPPLKETTNHNRPDPELMDRLSEALAVLPKDMQHQIVNRLIDSITSNLAPKAAAADMDTVPATKDDEDDAAAATPEIGMPLAAATLASLLKYYGNLVKENQEAKAATAVPVVPCHTEARKAEESSMFSISPRVGRIQSS